MTLASAATVDESIARMAHMPMSEVVTLSELKRPGIGLPYGDRNAAALFVGRLFTDAIFNQDIRAIQLIINRIDGGLPKDVEIGDYQTLFGDCLRDVMAMESGEQLKVLPGDSVMTAMCKSLYAMSVEDIYYDYERERPRRPTDAERRDRDNARRMILERTGGRKTLESAHREEREEVEEAGWIKGLLE